MIKRSALHDPWLRPTICAAIASGILLAAAPAVMAFDGIQFGPVGPGAGSTDSSSREFVKEYEVNPEKGSVTLSKANVAATKAAIKRYADVVAQGGWPTVPNVELKSGDASFAAAILRDRLKASGEYQGSGSGEVYDGELESAVKRYQANNGLTPTGVVDKRTIAALNVPAEGRLRQLKLGADRLTQALAGTAKRYVMVNIPAQQIEAVENGQIVDRFAGVVGKPDRPTPLLRTNISEMNFNPVWRLPPTVVSKDLIPRGREMQAAGKNVLVKFGIDAYDGSGKQLNPEAIDWASAQPAGLRYSQKPGKDNPLGFLKINFANAHSVYMHDSPKNSVFGRNFRADSSGCVRVSGIDRLAHWILAPQGWSTSHVEQMKEGGERKDVKVKKPVPLYFIYITAWASEDGAVQFRRDIYNRDGVGELAGAY
jgi:murein L,D-transpeptidase YcbB/YkuD